MRNDQLHRALNDVRSAVQSAVARHPQPFRSPHEGYAIILEELDELWNEVTKKKHDAEKLRHEALHVAATAVRFYIDLFPDRSVTAVPIKDGANDVCSACNHQRDLHQPSCIAARGECPCLQFEHHSGSAVSFASPTALQTFARQTQTMLDVLRELQARIDPATPPLTTEKR